MRFRQQRLPLFLTTILTFVVVNSTISRAATPGLSEEPIQLTKTPQYMTEQAREFLVERDNEVFRVWLFFVDKGFSDRANYDRVASAVTLTERALKRRAKVGLDRVLFVDLPVNQEYIDRVTALGGEFRRASRWLNAASFEIPIELLDKIGELPFIAYIKPLVTYERVEAEEAEGFRDSGGPTAQSPDALTYGPSQGQLQQINVPEVHAKGFTGEGVTLAIMDTGFRKTHEAFAQHYANNRVLAEWDFVFDDGNTANEAGDVSSQWNHGTLIWSVSAGQMDGSIYGPAYKANIILCKTEDLRSETPVEEDNWVAALEFSDSIGTDVITTSLGYSDWYTYEDMDGATAIITIAANTCDGLGIVFCNSMGNGGPSSGSLSAPADAFKILAVGNVNSSGFISSSSSRGPTFDDRTKPEVCAQGTTTFSASSSGDGNYTTASGTSLSTPLVAGAACLVIEARPDFTPELIRQAMKETSSNATSPDNTYGWGILDVDAAISWGSDFSADTTIGDAPLTVQFSGLSTLDPTSWAWSFGDGATSDEQNPSHIYELPGSYAVTLTTETSYGPLVTEKVGYVSVLGDTLIFTGDSVLAGKVVDISVSLRNSQPLTRIIIPFELPDSPIKLNLVDATLGARTSGFEGLSYLSFDNTNQRYTVELVADEGGGSLPLDPGEGEILVIRVTTDRYALGGLIDTVTSSPVSSFTAKLESGAMIYDPRITPGLVSTKWIQRCDVDYSDDGILDLGDLTALIEYLFIFTYVPPTKQSADCNADLLIDLGDLTYLIAYLFIGGPPPPTP
jgi:PKD repeat protein